MSPYQKFFKFLKKMIKKLFFIIIPLLIVLLGMLLAAKGFFFPEKIHYHAGFVVFDNNKKLDFSGSEYMNIKPCVAGEKDEDIGEDEQIEKAHLHDGVGDVVHIEASGALWKDLFSNIRYSVDYSAATGFINGIKATAFQNEPIRAYDSLVVFIGPVYEALLSQTVTREHILEKEKKSDDCGT